MDLKLQNNAMLLKTLGEGVKRRRLVKNISQAQLSESSGVSKASITRLETGSGNTSLFHLLSVLKVLDMLDEFMTLFRGLEVSPTLLAKALQSKTQKRVRKNKQAVKSTNEKWVWGEDAKK